MSNPPVTPRCPACDAEIVGEPAECPDCGLSFRGWAAEQPEAASAEEFEAFLGARELEEDPDVAANDDGRGDDPGAPSRESAPAFDGPRTLPDPAAVGIHAFAEAFVARLAECVPHAALDLGLHPHDPVALARDADEAAWGALSAEMLAALDAWEASAPRDIHDRIDARVLRGYCRGLPAAALVPAVAIEPAFTMLHRVLRLADVECCTAEERAAAGAVLLAQAAQEVQMLGSEPGEIARSTALALATCWAEDAEALRDFGRRWRGLGRAARKRLVSIAAETAAAFESASERMRTVVAPAATALPGIGATGLGALLREVHGLPFGVRGAWKLSLATLREAESELEASAGSAEPVEAMSRIHDIDFVRALHDRCGSWIRDVPAEPGLRVSIPLHGSEEFGDEGVFDDAGPFDPSGAGVMRIGAPPPRDDDSAWIRRRHTLAHETWPGHRLDGLVRRSLCAPRRLADDRMAVEGWAVYAEDLLHEAGACTNGPGDRHAVAAARRWRAVCAAASIVFAANVTTEEEILRLLGCPDPDDDLRAWLARNAADPVRSLTYVLGHAEVRRLRALAEARDGAAFDARDFHSRLLAEGAIPARWVAEAWGLDAEPAARVGP